MPLTHARRLLTEAATLYDHDPALRQAAHRAARGAFAGGARWMSDGLAALRGEPQPTPPERAWQRWGAFKYGACALASLVWLAALLRSDLGWLAPTVVAPFYAVEAQMVFLFPLLLDGADAPLRASRAWTLRAGGTARVALTVLPLAATMLLGGVLGRGFVRSWCLGCVAVLLWYEELRRAEAPAGAALRHQEATG